MNIATYTNEADGIKATVDQTGAGWNKKTCDYWYLAQDRNMAHTAFHHREGLLTWLADRGLTIEESKLAPHMQGGEWEGRFPSYLRIQGAYRETHHLSYDEFYALPNVIIETKTLSNGDVVLARITQEEDGIRSVHTLNPNCKFRQTFDHAEYRSTH